jgi:hypothetical protein
LVYDGSVWFGSIWFWMAWRGIARHAIIPTHAIHVAQQAVLLQRRGRMNLSMRTVARARLARSGLARRRRAAARMMQRCFRARYRFCCSVATYLQRRIRSWLTLRQQANAFVFALCRYRLSCHSRSLRKLEQRSPLQLQTLRALPFWHLLDRYLFSIVFFDVL